MSHQGWSDTADMIVVVTEMSLAIAAADAGIMRLSWTGRLGTPERMSNITVDTTASLSSHIRSAQVSFSSLQRAMSGKLPTELSLHIPDLVLTQIRASIVLSVFLNGIRGPPCARALRAKAHRNPRFHDVPGYPGDLIGIDLGRDVERDVVERVEDRQVARSNAISQTLSPSMVIFSRSGRGMF